MSDREDIVRRHGIPHVARKLVGDTPEKLEAGCRREGCADVAVAPHEPDEDRPEPPIEGLPPKNTPVTEWTEQE